MILVRAVFRLKFGQAREALTAFEAAGDSMAHAGVGPPSYRLLTDLVGPYYTLVLESTYPSLAELEDVGKRAMGNQEWRKAYQGFTPHVESGYREIFTIVE